MRRAKLSRLSALVAAAVLLLTACAPNAVSSVASATGTPHAAALPSPSTWTAARVEQPAAIEAAPTNAPVFCSPCHPVIGTYIDSLVAFRGGFLAFGHDQPPSHAALWSSADAVTWKRVDGLPAPEGSTISAAIVGSGGAVLAVGQSAGVAADWKSADGVAWTLTSLPAPTAGSTEILTTVAVAGSGYVAGGYIQSALAVRTASLWLSADGTTWTRATVQVPDGSSEVTGIAAVGSKLVAVGIAGDERRGTAAVWRSSDGGLTWTSMSSPALARGRMLAVAAAGPGLVSVGELDNQTGAAAWFSADGSTWGSAGGPGLRNGGLQMVITAVGRTGSGIVAAGWRTDPGNGSAVVLRSSDGLTWLAMPQEPTFSGAGLSSLLGAPRLLVAGTMGWPDTHSAQVWIAAGS
jgi:hypothetical protein